MNKVYLITYNTGPTFNREAFHEHIKKLDASKKISDWWHYLNDAYLVVSNLTVNHLYEAIHPALPEKQRLLIIEVKPSNSQGWLAKEAWEWIIKYH